MELFSMLVEKSRQAKNFGWKANEPVTLFPNWQDEYYTNTQQTSPSRNSRPGSTTDSPVILPGTFASNAPPLVAPSTPGISAPPPTGSYTPDFRSPSPVSLRRNTTTTMQPHTSLQPHPPPSETPQFKPRWRKQPI
ncbi:hypothetical protein BCR33DRAFT_501713 [Rhizoclosmatium globosum]|uniref:Uncharacterized protein n=1 Tax=Rhizoclosmatium globosum TaxID=329046 RepID=A0A1Y2CVW5_9FUNG|nr:hypothetical protein BCR33DRAFT_501713 [Rhizoclosmatium globosum]|eukprot:ORY51046.1 hypothetical protein BCR33DRAFT_501713 [Rhizoclosmatium globosum]